MLDWLACAAAGRGERAAVVAEAAANRATWLGTAGHVLDFDDTWTPGLAHLSAPTAPAALLTAAEQGGTLTQALAGYKRGFESMATLAGAAHPALYDRHLHPTAVTGAAGAAIAAGAVFGLDDERLAAALALGLIRGAGLRAAFGGDGKALQVGGAVSAGLAAARLAAGGAEIDTEQVLAGACRSWGIRELDLEGVLAPGDTAIADNWIKRYPCCLQTHSAIEAALGVDATRLRSGHLRMRVHPISLQAAGVVEPRTGLEAKFSLPYLISYALLQGAPTVEGLAEVDPEVLAGAGRVEITSDPDLDQSEAVLDLDGYELTRVVEALGSPSRPMSAAELEAKVTGLAGAALAAAMDDLTRPAADLLELAGF